MIFPQINGYRHQVLIIKSQFLLSPFSSINNKFDIKTIQMIYCQLPQLNFQFIFAIFFFSSRYLMDDHDFFAKILDILGKKF